MALCTQKTKAVAYKTYVVCVHANRLSSFLLSPYSTCCSPAGLLLCKHTTHMPHPRKFALALFLFLHSFSTYLYKALSPSIYVSFICHLTRMAFPAHLSSYSLSVYLLLFVTALTTT